MAALHSTHTTSTSERSNIDPELRLAFPGWWAVVVWHIWQRVTGRWVMVTNALAPMRIIETFQDLSVPKTSSTSCDQAVFVDQTTDASLSSDPVLTEIDRLG